MLREREGGRREGWWEAVCGWYELECTVKILLSQHLMPK